MSLASKPACRRMWMFPRNIRRIEPWKIAQFATLLDAAEGRAGTQKLQDDLYEQLELLGVKRPKADDGSGVEKPGGLRTYLAQLACLGLFCVDKEKCYVPTHAGELVIQGRNPVGVLRCQLLRLQYPSVYGWGRNVLISPEMRVKPFAFLVRILEDPRLGGELSRSEAAVCVVYGRTRGDFEKCVGKILELRRNKSESIRPVVDSLTDICTPRRWDLDDDELWEKGITDANQIANTALNYLYAVGLVEAEPVGGRLVYNLTTDQKALADIRRWMKEEAKIEDVPEDPDGWIHAQLRFGRFDKAKVMSIGSRPRTDGLAAIVRTAYISAAEADPFGFDHGEFVKEKALYWHKSEAEIEACVTELRGRTDDIARSKLIYAAGSGGVEARLLEIGMTNIFRKLGFDLAQHLGQRKVPATAKRRGGYPDIYLRASSEPESGMADTKATMKYGFPLSDTEKLGSYYHDAWKEIDPKSPCRFFLYIAGSFASSHQTILQKLQGCSADYGSPVSAVTVYALLDLAANAARPPVGELMKVFGTSRFFNSDAQIIDAAAGLK